MSDSILDQGTNLGEHLSILWACSSVHLIDGWDDKTYQKYDQTSFDWIPSGLEEEFSFSWSMKSAVPDPSGILRGALQIKHQEGLLRGNAACELSVLRKAVGHGKLKPEKYKEQVNWSAFQSEGTVSYLDVIIHAALGHKYCLTINCPEIYYYSNQKTLLPQLIKELGQKTAPALSSTPILDLLELQEKTKQSSSGWSLVLGNRILCWSSCPIECTKIATRISHNLRALATEKVDSKSIRPSEIEFLNRLLAIRSSVSKKSKKILSFKNSPVQYGTLSGEVNLELSDENYPLSFSDPILGSVGVAINRHTASRVANLESRAQGLSVLLNNGKTLPRSRVWRNEASIGLSAPENRELEGHIVIVTGAASGIGLEVAKGLSSRGAHLVLVDHDEEALCGAANSLSLLNPDRIEAVAADLTVGSDVERAFNHCVLNYGGVDAVVSGAGAGSVGFLRDLSETEWQKCMDVNVKGHFFVTKHALRMFEQQNLGGSLVYIASKTAVAPGLAFGAYAIAKAAELQLARVAAIEGGEFGVRSNVVNPGALFEGSQFWTPAIRAERASLHGIDPETLPTYYARRNLLRREITCRDVAETVGYLVSNRSSATTGCIMTVDGGDDEAFPR